MQGVKVKSPLLASIILDFAFSPDVAGTRRRGPNWPEGRKDQRLQKLTRRNAKRSNAIARDSSRDHLGASMRAHVLKCGQLTKVERKLSEKQAILRTSSCCEPKGSGGRSNRRSAGRRDTGRFLRSASRRDEPYSA